MTDLGVVKDRATRLRAALDFDVIHFSTVFPGRALPRLTRQIESRGAQVVYDLEDTHWIPTDADLTAELRRRARRDLTELLDSPSATGSFSVRVNAFGTEDGDRDLALLASLAPRHRPHAVILPKVDSAATVEAFLQACDALGVTCHEVIPLVETTRGVNGLDALLAGLTAMNAPSLVRRIMYGAFDHCLDSDRWPFWHQAEPEFWETIQGLVRTIEARGFGYIHTPFGGLQAPSEFTMTIQRLGETCRDRFTISTLDEAQVNTVRRARDVVASALAAPREVELSGADALALAYRVVKQFDERRRRDVGFVVDSGTGRFIPPHEYVAARRHIQRMDRAQR